MSKIITVIIRILNIIILGLIAVSLIMYLYMLYNLIKGNNVDFSTLSPVFLVVFFFAVFLYAIKNIISISFKIFEYKTAIKGDALKMSSIVEIAKLRIPHARLYLCSHISLLFFVILLACFMHKYGNTPVAELGNLISPLLLLLVTSLIFFVITRILFFIKNKKLDDLLFDAQVEHYKREYERKKKDGE